MARLTVVLYTGSTILIERAYDNHTTINNNMTLIVIGVSGILLLLLLLLWVTGILFAKIPPSIINGGITHVGSL